MCQGYYRHEKGYTPEWAGMADFKGQIVHPQAWPADLDLKDKRVVVIGSGATAATLIPNIAADCAHVTMLQRSPTYFIPGQQRQRPSRASCASWRSTRSWIHEIVRRRILKDQDAFTRRSLEEPEAVKQELLGAVKMFLGADYDVDTHFTPRYRPWRQRIAFIPDGDLFQRIASGKASVATGEIDRFVAEGIRLKSGDMIEADLVVTATGFDLSVLGDAQFTVDGRPLDFGQTVNYRGMMFTGVPNLAWVFGYFRASWTLRADIVADFVCRLLNHMDESGAKKVEVALRPEDEGMPLHSWIDPENFNPGYLMRSMHLLPKRGDKPEWQHTQDYWREKDELPAIDLDGAEFVYSGRDEIATTPPKEVETAGA